jgi:hypothetical protein
VIRPDFWTARTDWPARYAIRLLVGDGERTVEYTSTTRLGPEKAVALAVAMHTRRSGLSDGVHDVAVDLIGRAPTGASGQPEAMPGDLVDHLEFR